MAEGHGSTGEVHVEGTYALLFVVTCFVIGIATKFFLSWVKIPYTALLLVSTRAAPWPADLQQLLTDTC
jgi:hypothetical protein